MSSKQDILRRVRQSQPPAVDLPALTGPWTTFDDLRSQFATTVQQVGGQVVMARDRAHADQLVKALASYQDAAKICSLVDGVGRSDVELLEVERPHDLADVDLTIAAGKFAVAENGAVWVSAAQVRHQAIYFLCQHLALVVPGDQIVHHMHEAYDRLASETSSFGVFISGPSKTADIEQSLVIGAQGPRSLTVVLI